MRKPVFESSRTGKLNPACSTSETNQGLDILDITPLCIILSRQQITKVQIRLHGCAGFTDVQADLCLCRSHMESHSLMVSSHQKSFNYKYIGSSFLPPSHSHSIP